MRLKKLTSTAPGGNILLDYAYDYDDAGNIMSKQTEHGDYSYGYDSASRLTSADNPTLEDESYAYDEVGNRTSASNAEGEIVHNANNELLNYGEIEFLYDDNGNMIQKKLGDVAVNYVYNATNRLIRVEDDLTGLVIAEYAYDPFGRRLWKESSGIRAYFFYSDEGLIGEYDVNGIEICSYGYRPDSIWMTDPIFLHTESQYYFYQNDHLGTPQKLVAQNGTVVWSAHYSAFGEATVEIKAVTNNLRFPGQYYDEETGLHYNWFRYYDGEQGRYLKKDPIGFSGKEVNLYLYSKDNPIRVLDPLGLYIYFAIYYNKGTSFERAAQTWEREVKERPDWDPNCDVVILKGVRTKYDFISAWNYLAAYRIPSNPACKCPSNKIKEGIIFTHASKDGSWPGLEFERPLDPDAGLGVGYEAVGPSHKLTTENITELEELPWTGEGTLSLQGCNTALPLTGGFPSLAEEFANDQNVYVYGQNGYSDFSEDDLRYVEIDTQGEGTSTTVYLRPYDRGDNRTIPHVGGSGELIPPTKFGPSL